MVKSVLSSLPMFYICCLGIPVTIKDQVIKYMRHCLWRKTNNDIQAHGKALVARNKICRPKDQGGLGLMNLETQNKDLLLKNLHKFHNDTDIPWVKLIRGTYYNSGRIPNTMEGSF
jgi:hypothetical protein